MSSGEINFALINFAIKDLGELKKFLQNLEYISSFFVKCESRFNARIKLHEILLTYLSDIDISLPVVAQINLHNILMNILSFSFLYFCIYIIKSIVNIII
jgi:hypothetical protein